MKIEQKLSIPLGIISLGNIVTGLITGQDFVYYIFYVAIFIIIIGILNLIKKDISKPLSYILMGLSIIGIWVDNPSILLSVALYAYSMFIGGRKERFDIIFFVSLITQAMIRFTIMDMSSIQMTLYLSGSAFIFIIYQHYIHPKRTGIVIPESNGPTIINPDVIDILNLRIKGLDWSEINVILELNIADERVRRKVTDECRKHKYKTKEAFVYDLTKKGIIKSV